MPLRAKKPETIIPRLKCLFYGSAGVGKTTAAIQFPNVYLIDTECGAIHEQYTKQINKSGGAIFQTTDFDELLTEVKALLTEEHEYKTLVIDPLTTLYNDLLDKSALKVGTDFGRHYGEANKKMKHLLMLLTRLDANVIITAHSKNEYGQNMSLLGTTFDCYKKLDYLFDLVFEIQKRGKERVGVIKKSRLESFPDGDVFPFSYDIIADRYGRDILEKVSECEKLASKEQIEEIWRLVQLLKIHEETYVKWLEKAKANAFDEMNSDVIQKCIDHLKKQISG